MFALCVELLKKRIDLQTNYKQIIDVQTNYKNQVFQ